MVVCVSENLQDIIVSNSQYSSVSTHPDALHIFLYFYPEVLLTSLNSLHGTHISLSTSCTYIWFARIRAAVSSLCLPPTCPELVAVYWTVDSVTCV